MIKCLCFFLIHENPLITLISGKLVLINGGDASPAFITRTAQ